MLFHENSTLKFKDKITQLHERYYTSSRQCSPIYLSVITSCSILLKMSKTVQMRQFYLMTKIVPVQSANAFKRLINVDSSSEKVICSIC